MMPGIVASVVKRHMKHTSPGAFTRSDVGAKMPVEVALAANEMLVGWYRNPEPWEQCFIVFTSEAFYLVEGGRSERIAVADIIGYESPTSKHEVTGVRVLTRDGFRFVRIAGSFGPAGNRKDAYCFLDVVRALCPGEPVVSTNREPPDRV